MERLTKRNSDGMIEANKLKYYNYNNFQKMAQKLAEYKNLEEQGLLLRLPCKIGSEVWEIERQLWIDHKGCKDCIYFGNDGLGDYCDYDEDNPPACTKIVPKKFNIRMLDNFGKTVFLTQAEAEQKLKEMENEQDGNTLQSTETLG